MTNGYVIEIADLDAGLVVRDGKSFAFLATTARFRPLDGQRFATPAAAERAAWTLYHRRGASAERRVGAR
jgi:hypothetical protein